MPIVNFPGTSETATTAQHRPRTRTVQRLQQGGAQPASPSEPLYDSANGPSGSLPTPLGNMPALSQTHPYSTILISLEETHLPKGNGSGRTRTCNPRIWSPVLYPIRATDPHAQEVLLQDFSDDASAHRATPLPNRKPQPLVHRYRRQQRHRHLRVVPRHHHLCPSR